MGDLWSFRSKSLILKSGLVVISDLRISHQEKPVVLVGGATATGKSDLAIMLAKKLNGEVLNIDSVQLYQELQIGAAKLKPEDMQGIPHHLMNILSPDNPGSVAEYLEHALSCMRDLHIQGKSCIFAGGTGMYVSSLFHGLAKLPERSDQLRAELETLQGKELFERLRSIDPASAERIHPNDRFRLVRAVEATELTGTPYSEQLAAHKGANPIVHGLCLIPCHERDVLYERINRRACAMVEQGLFDEVRQLVDRYGENAPALKSLGYAQVVKSITGEIPEEGVVELIAQQTRRFAKRQMTYWRNEPLKRGWAISPEQGGSEGRSVGDTTHVPGARRALKGFTVLSLTGDELAERVRERLNEPFEISEVWYLDAARL
jgi:tRNA dimethylallyltransferase